MLSVFITGMVLAVTSIDSYTWNVYDRAEMYTQRGLFIVTQHTNNDDINVNTQKDVTNEEAMISAGQVTIKAGTIVNKGTIKAGKQVQIHGQGNVDNSGTIEADEDVTIQSQGDFTNSGHVQAGENVDIQTTKGRNTGSIQAGDDVNVDATQFTDEGQIEAGGDINIQEQADD